MISFVNRDRDFHRLRTPRSVNYRLICCFAVEIAPGANFTRSERSLIFRLLAGSLSKSEKRVRGIFSPYEQFTFEGVKRRVFHFSSLILRLHRGGINVDLPIICREFMEIEAHFEFLRQYFLFVRAQSIFKSIWKNRRELNLSSLILRLHRARVNVYLSFIRGNLLKSKKFSGHVRMFSFRMVFISGLCYIF